MDIKNDAPTNFQVEVTQPITPEQFKSPISGKYIPADKRVKVKTVSGKEIIYHIDELRILLSSTDNPIDPITGERIASKLEDFKDK